MKTFIILVLILLSTFAEAYDNSQSKQDTAQRIKENFNIQVDWETNSLSNLINMESKLSTAKRINDNYGLSLNWKTTSLSDLINIESKISTAIRIKKNHNITFNWKEKSLTELIDAESRISTAKRLSKSLGKTIDWSKFSLLQLIEAENKLNQKTYQKKPNYNYQRQSISRPIQTSSVIESSIDGEFEGWEGETIIKLMNGQIWQQTEYYYEYMYAYMPSVIIFNSHGMPKMKVEGIDKAVGVEQLK
jgi:plasmid maintenance system killer protein